MADSEKGDSSSKEAKAKTSLIDDDFSKDFLGSWKSMSATGGDDMDFNFEPVSKGKKKAFDFGMDMDFSLDDAFGKMSSFKIDMPDLDFSSSPKKSTKSKEKPEEDSAKGNHLDKHDNFTFSFDFNGLADFNLDAPSTKGGKSPSREKKNQNDGSEFEDVPKRVTNDKKETTEDSISKGPAVSDDTALSKTEDLCVGDIPSVSCASKWAASSYPIQPTEPDKKQISSEKEFSHQEEEASFKKSCSPGREGVLDPISVNRPPQLVGSSIPVESAEVHLSSGTEKTMSSLSTEDVIQLKEEKSSLQLNTQLKEKNLSTNTPLLEASVQADVSEGLEISSPQRKVSNGSSEGGFVAGELPAAADLTSATEKPILDKLPQECSIDKMNINDGKIELGNRGYCGRSKLLLGTVAPNATCETKVLSSSARSTAEIQIPVLKVSSASIGSGPSSAAKAMTMKNKVPVAMNSKFSVTQSTKDGGRTELSSYEDNKEGSTHISAMDRSSYGGRKHNEKKSDDNPSSCTKELIKSDSVKEKCETISAANTPRDQEDTLIREDRNEMSVNSLLPEGNEAKNGLSSLECEKMVYNNVKSSGLKNPSLTPPEQGTTSANLEQGKLEDKISSISSIQKSNIVQGNNLSSQRNEKKVLSLPSLKLARSIATDKQLPTATKQRNFGSLRNFEKSTRSQAAIKMVSPVSAEKQTPSSLSLKRKSSEAADMDPAKLHMPKRVSPNESRITKASAREIEEGDQTQVNFDQESRKNVSVECTTPKFDFDQEANIEALQFSMMVENDENVEKAEACAKELDNICNMLKKKHEEAKELLVRALVNNNYLLMLNHPIYEEKIRAVQRIASRLMIKELEVEA